eukprot:GHVU01077699.1.p1 GENE.GHVU01077699.1~~GHVU01077699.1.p1  ORF type:complete len:139 (-),score=16.59 GHVU01077699.1:256-672(-)
MLAHSFHRPPPYVPTHAPPDQQRGKLSVGRSGAQARSRMDRPSILNSLHKETQEEPSRLLALLATSPRPHLKTFRCCCCLIEAGEARAAAAPTAAAPGNSNSVAAHISTVVAVTAASQRAGGELQKGRRQQQQQQQHR